MQNKMAPLEAYAHGAQLVLLDGIGLGVGMPAAAAAGLRAKCHKFLMDQLPSEIHPSAALAAGDSGPIFDTPSASISHSVSDSASDHSLNKAAERAGVVDAMQIDEKAPAGYWGIAPFFVARGPSAPSHPASSAFSFQAPTTARNAMRVLRALQVLHIWPFMQFPPLVFVPNMLDFLPAIHAFYLCLPCGFGVRA